MAIGLTTQQRQDFIKYLTGQEHAYASTLLSILGYLYGTEFLSSTEDQKPWTPQTLQLQVLEDTNIDIDEKVMDKIQAAITGIIDDRVFDDAVIFHHIATALWDEDVMPDEWDEPEPEEIAWAFAELMLLRGEADPNVEIGDDVETYTRVVLQRDGFSRAPKKLWWVALPELGEEDYSDDPAMFESIFKEAQRKADEVDSIVDENLQKLLEQVSGLPLGEQWFQQNRLFEATAQPAARRSRAG